jgi:hypothetical protein
VIGTFEALLVVIVALLPGATYTWAFELQAGRRGANFSDRVWRFAGSSAVFTDRRIDGLRGPSTTQMGALPHGLCAISKSVGPRLHGTGVERLAAPQDEGQLLGRWALGSRG